MKPLIILLLILLSISNSKGDNFSIDTFLNYLQEKGLYDILMNIKYYFGDDVSIAFCKELIKNQNCETVIRIYISSRVRGELPIEESIMNIAQLIDYYYQALIDAGFKPFEIERVKNLMMKYA